MSAQLDLFNQPILDHEPKCSTGFTFSDHPSLADFAIWWNSFEFGHLPTTHELLKFRSQLEDRIQRCAQLASTIRNVGGTEQSIELADWYVLQAKHLLNYWDDLYSDFYKRPEVRS